MTTRTKVILIAVALVTSYGFGRWASPVRVVTQVKTVEVEKKTENTHSDTDRNKHVETVTTETRKPDGTIETTTKTVQDTQTKQDKTDSQTDQLDKTSTQSKEVVYSSAKVTVSGLAGLRLSYPTPVYGASLTKPILGPVTIGAFGLSDRTAGLSLGLTF